MKPNLGLNLGLRTELKLQPRQILCNELLTLAVLDLQAALETELAENVFLEAEERPDGPEQAVAQPVKEEMTPPGGEGEQVAEGEDSLEPGQLRQLLDYLKESKSSVAPSGGDVPDAFDVEARVAPASDWRQEMMDSVRLERMPDDVRVAAEYLVGCLNDRGMLEENIEEIAQATKTEFDAVEEALEIVQRVAPPGVGARSDQERLILRCRALPEPNPILEKVLREGYDELLRNRFDELRRKLGISELELRDAISALRNLRFDPIEIEDGEPAAGVVPDASVVKDDETGRWKVLLHDEAVPRLRMSAYASSLARQSDSLPDDAKDYIMRSLHRAKWMMDALDQRRTTLRRIMEAVVERQEGFFDEGYSALVPLRQEDISEQLNLHASTISRAVQEKYVETPHGVYPLKTFFPRGVTSSTGEMQARNSVQGRLAQLVENEDPKRPLSDDALKRLLARESIKLSRRTICKYRDELGIAPASRRRSMYELMASKPK